MLMSALELLIGLTVFGVLIGLARLAGPVEYRMPRTSRGNRHGHDEGDGGQPDTPPPQPPFFPGG